MATKLGLYNAALRVIGDYMLASLNENSEARRQLDAVYDDTLQHCLENGMWNFAIRYAAITQDGVGSQGFSYVYNKPTDLVHVFQLSTTENFDTQMTYDFLDQAGKIYANPSQLYIRYTSNDAAYGGDLTKWPTIYAYYVAAALASMVAFRLTGSAEITKFAQDTESLRHLNALAVCSLVSPPGMLPFNSTARQPPQTDSRERLLPFGRYAMQPQPQDQGKSNG